MVSLNSHSLRALCCHFCHARNCSILAAAVLQVAVRAVPATLIEAYICGASGLFNPVHLRMIEACICCRDGLTTKNRGVMFLTSCKHTVLLKLSPSQGIFAGCVIQPGRVGTASV